MKLSVITPTYNRAYVLNKCYQSLCDQTVKDFIWVVIDDGSTDNTWELIEKWKKDNVIQIEYTKKTNGGKASALNVAIDIITTPYAVCLDSDDYFYSQAVECALRELETIEKNEKCCGILALRNHENGIVIGGKEIPNEMMYVKAEDIFLKLKLQTELICFYKTDLLKKYRFPEFPGEKFVSPSWMQYEITQTYIFKVSRDRLCCCEYIEDGLTRNKRRVILNNPKGYACVKRYSFDLSNSFLERIKHGIAYNYACILSKDRLWLKNVKHKGSAIILYPAGYLLYLYRNRKGL